MIAEAAYRAVPSKALHDKDSGSPSDGIAPGGRSEQGPGFRIAAHIGSSGMAPLAREALDQMSEEQFGLFLELHLRACSEPKTLGMSPHGIVDAEKGGALAGPAAALA